jgi:hypothetical protein
MGGGVALLDYDNDGRLDVFFTNGAKLDDPMPGARRPDKSDREYWNRLYRQNAGRHVRRRHREGGLSGMPQNRYGMGVAVGDYDNDGFADLYVTNFGGNTLYHNNGDGTFSDVTGARRRRGGVERERRVLRRRQRRQLDLFVTRYVDWTFETNRYCGEKKPGYRAYCHPDNYEGVANILYHNNGDGTFTTSREGRHRRAAARARRGIRDYDRDGYMDVYVATTRCSRSSTATTRRHVQRGGPARRRGVQRGRQDLRRHGRGLRRLRQRRPARHRRHRPLERALQLFRQNADGSFRDATNTSGVGGLTLLFSAGARGSWTTTTTAGRISLVAQGHVMDTIEKTSPNLTYQQPPLLLRNESGRFSRVEPATRSPQTWAGRGAAFGDLDNDGDDRRRAEQRRPEGRRASERRLVTATIGWRFETVGTTSNRDGIGCLVKVVSASGLSQSFTVNTAVGYLSASDKRLLVGARQRRHREARRDPLALRNRPDDSRTWRRQTLTATEPAR